jgi:hypothetical protein
MNKTSIIFLFVLLILASNSVNASAFRCGADLVDTGETKFNVLKKCGEPAYKHSWTEEVINTHSENKVSKVFNNIEEWTYNPGSDSFVRVLRFRNSQLIDIETRGYGTSGAPSIVTSCDEKIVNIGDTTAQVIMKCGQPAFKENQQEEIAEDIDNDLQRKVFVLTEEWTYNFGPNRFTDVLTLKNGRLVKVQKGTRGF